MPVNKDGGRSMGLAHKPVLSYISSYNEPEITVYVCEICGDWEGDKDAHNSHSFANFYNDECCGERVHFGISCRARPASHMPPVFTVSRLY